MRKGKIAAQVAHASMGVILNLGWTMPSDSGPDYFTFPLSNAALEEWISGSFTKICVSVGSEAELLALEAKAKELGVLNCLITDSGKTEFHGVPTNTCLAIGPDTVENVDRITSGLPLL